MDSQYVKIMSKIFNYFDSLTWDSIVWKISYHKVRCIQKRIFKASCSNQMKRVFFLQKLLLRNPHAKLIAVQKVIRLKPYLNCLSSEEKIQLAQKLKLNGKAVHTGLRIKSENFFQNPSSFRTKLLKEPFGKNNKNRKRGNLEMIQDKAKQFLCLLALEPEWEAKFENDFYKTGRSAHDAIENILTHLSSNQDKYVFTMNLRNNLLRLDYDKLFQKWQSFPLMNRQLKAWLKAGMFSEYVFSKVNILAPFLVNILFHGLDEHLLYMLESFPENSNTIFCSDKVETRVLSKKNLLKTCFYEGKARERGLAKNSYLSTLKGRYVASESSFCDQVETFESFPQESELGIVRYLDRIVFIHKNKDSMQLVILETLNWLNNIGLALSEEKYESKLASQSFEFLGFQIHYIGGQKNFSVKVTPSKGRVLQLIAQTRNIIQKNKAASAYKLIEMLRPILLNWANYFKFCDCKNTFLKLDNIIFQQLRAWVFRRAIRQGRKKVKEKYFPSNKKIFFQNRVYWVSWVLHGSKKYKQGPLTTIYLPKLSWIRKEKWVKIKVNVSIYSSNDENYWVKRYSV